MSGFHNASLSIALVETMQSDIMGHGFNSHSGLYIALFSKQQATNHRCMAALH